MKKIEAANTVRTARIAVPNSRKRPTKDLLIEVGEQLFGQRGFDGVSLREIAAAGQSNSNVVQYHFGDKPGLIGAILQDRVIRAERVRCMQLAMLDTHRSVEPRQLLKILGGRTPAARRIRSILNPYWTSPSRHSRPQVETRCSVPAT